MAEEIREAAGEGAEVKAVAGALVLFVASTDTGKTNVQIKEVRDPKVRKKI